MKGVRSKLGTLVLAVAVLLIYLLLSGGPTTGFEREIALQVEKAVLAKRSQLTITELAQDHPWDRACVLHSYWTEKHLTNALGWSIENYWASLGDDNEGRWTLLIADSNAKSAARVRISRDACDLGTKKTVECADKVTVLEFAYAESKSSSRSNCVARIGKGMRPDTDWLWRVSGKSVPQPH